MTGTRPPGRPRAFKTDEVLDAAVELFWSQGYRGTTTRALERAAGLSQSSLYNAFGSKGELLAAALDRYESLQTSTVFTPLETSDAGLEAIDAFFIGLGAFLADGERGCLLINMMAEDGGRTPEITERTHRYRQRLRTALDSALERAEAFGEIAPAPGRVDSLISATIGLNLAARSGLEPGELEALVAGLRSLVASWRR